LPGDHRKVYSNRSEADFVMPSGIITTYLTLRLLVGRGFINIYPNHSVSARLLSLVSDYATHQELARPKFCRVGCSALALSIYRT
jgi:hypothetical protein